MTAASPAARPPSVRVPPRFNAAAEYIDRPVAEGHGPRTAIFFRDEAMTYAALRERVNRFAGALRALGIKQGERVAVLLRNRPEFVIAFYGALKAGAVAAPVSWAVTPAEQRFLIADCEARALVTDAALWAPLRDLRPAMPSLQHTVLVGPTAALGAGEHDFDALLSAGPPEFEAAPTRRDDLAFFLHTSGSTGTPKWAVHLHSHMPYCEQLYARPAIGLRPVDIVLSGSPCFHAYSLGMLTYFPFRAGAAVVLSPERTTPQHMFDLIAKHRPTVFASVPTLYAQMLKAAETAKPDLSSLRICISAAEALPAEIYRRFRQRFGVEIVDGMGSTEALHTFISNRAGEVRPGSSGKPMPGYEVRLVDEEGRDVPDGEPGGLWVKGGSLFAGYWHREDVNCRVLRDGWFITGDTYLREADGFFWYQGRTDDMLRVSGHWVSPPEVEGVLMKHPAVLEAAVVGKRDADELVKPQAFIVLRDPSAASEELKEELKRHVKASMAPYCYPRWIEFVKELPKTATGKIQRFRLRESSP